MQRRSFITAAAAAALAPLTPLVLAQESIARASADRPPAERFDTALKEVLWMRAGGMGWGRIAFITAGRNRTGAGIPRKGGS